jgi:hypothetical protein
MDFGRWAPGACSDRRYVSLVNESDRRIFISGVRSAHFQTPYLLFSGPVEPHASLGIAVVFVSDPDAAAAYDEEVTVPMTVEDQDRNQHLLEPGHFRAHAITEPGAPCGPFLMCPDSGLCSGPSRCVCDVEVHISNRHYVWSCAVGAATPGVACNDHNSCTANDHCTDDAGQCLGTPGPSIPCDDGNNCTQNDSCQANGMCTGSGVTCLTPPTACADGTHQWIYSYPGACVPPGGPCEYRQVGVIACGNGCDADAGTCF